MIYVDGLLFMMMLMKMMKMMKCYWDDYCYYFCLEWVGIFGLGMEGLVWVCVRFDGDGFCCWLVV